MKPANAPPAGSGSSIITVLGLAVAFALLVWMVLDSSGLLNKFLNRAGGHPHVIDVTADNWQKEVVESELPVLVDFWAPWCGPCVKLSPTIEKIATAYSGKVKVCKVNVDEAPSISAKYRVQAIPTVFLFDKSEVVQVMQGPTERNLVDAINAVVAQ